MANGSPALEGVQYEVRAQGDAALLHLWGAAAKPGAARARVWPKNRANAWSWKSAVSGIRGTRGLNSSPLPDRASRAAWIANNFRDRLRQILTDRFPDETVDSLVTSADLRHSLSGSYTRGLMHRGSEAFAVLGASPNEDGATIDGILTFGLIWLQTRAGPRQALFGLWFAPVPAARRSRRSPRTA